MIPDGAVGRPTDRTRAPAAHTAPPHLLLCGIQTWKAGRVSERSCDGGVSGDGDGASEKHRLQQMRPWCWPSPPMAAHAHGTHTQTRAHAPASQGGRHESHRLGGPSSSSPRRWRRRLCCAPPLASSICWPPWRRGLYRHHLVPASVTMSPSRPLFLRTLVMGLRAALFQHETLS